MWQKKNNKEKHLSLESLFGVSIFYTTAKSEQTNSSLFSAKSPFSLVGIETRIL